MRSFAFLILSAILAFSAEFTTGQAARLVIGQPTFTAQKPYADVGTDKKPVASADILGGVGGLAYANDMLFVTDANRLGAAPINHRVLIYKGLSSMLPAPAAELTQGKRCPACVGAATAVLGQPDFTKADFHLAQTGLRLPVAVASDGTVIAVADSDNNRILIWKQIPSANGAPADVVLGQPDFTHAGIPRTPNAKSMRGPQGVWIQNGKLFVADTHNNRVLIWNSIPASNGQPADLVLGQPNFETYVTPDIFKAGIDPKPNTMLTPVSVTSDGTRLYLADLGHNRVLIWNSIPTANQQPADVVLGQKDLTSAVANDSKNLCPSNGTDSAGKPTYPARCNATMDFPRYALSDGQRLFIADGGNDRVLVYNSVPTANSQGADVVLGQPGPEVNLGSDFVYALRRSSADSLRSPLSLAWDGVNLFVADPFNRRVMVFSPTEKSISSAGVRNAASWKVFAVGAVSFSGKIQANDEVTTTIAGKAYKYKLVKDDTFDAVVTNMVNLINAGEGDPNAFATPDTPLASVILTARKEGADGQAPYSVSTSQNAVIIGKTSGTSLSGGQDAAKIAAGTLVSIIGENLAEAAAVGEHDSDGRLPTELGGVQIYFDGIRSPLLYVSPKQVNAQVPFEVSDTTSLNAFLRVKWSDGRVTATNPVAVPIIPQNPGIFALGGTDPRPAVALHYSSFATGTISVDGSAAAGDIGTVKIEDRAYSYTVKTADTLDMIRRALIGLINADPKVEAFPSGTFTRIRLKARVAGASGVGIKYSVSTSANAKVILSPTGNALCCANVSNSLVETANPLIPGETVIIYTTGLGLIKPEDAQKLVVTGQKYQGPELNEPQTFVSSLCGSKTANVLYAGMKPGAVGLYEIHLELNSDIPTDPRTQCTIAQDVYVSNIVTVPVVNPKPPPTP